VYWDDTTHACVRVAWQIVTNSIAQQDVLFIRYVLVLTCQLFEVLDPPALTLIRR